MCLEARAIRIGQLIGVPVFLLVSHVGGNGLREGLVVPLKTLRKFPIEFDQWLRHTEVFNRIVQSPPCIFIVGSLEGSDAPKPVVSQVAGTVDFGHRNLIRAFEL